MPPPPPPTQVMAPPQPVLTELTLVVVSTCSTTSIATATTTPVVVSTPNALYSGPSQEALDVLTKLASDLTEAVHYKGMPVLMSESIDNGKVVNETPSKKQRVMEGIKELKGFYQKSIMVLYRLMDDIGAL